MKLVYYKNLDGIRAIAALLVMNLHFWGKININSSILSFFHSLASVGQTGITLFFVLSGFLITRILLNKKNTNNFFTNFYFRRLLRIFPLYYLFLLIYYFIYPILLNSQPFEFNEIIYYLIYLQNFALTFNWNTNGPGHFWSLAVEEHFYLFWPILIFYFNNKKIIYIICLLILFPILLRFYMLTKNFEISWFTLTQIDSLAIGSLLSFLEKNKTLNLKFANKFFIPALSLIFIISLFIFLSNNVNEIYYQSIKYTLWGLIYFFILAYLLSINSKHLFNLFLGNSFLNFTGKISYGLYVYHFIILDIIIYHFNNEYWIINFILYFIATYIISTLSYFLFEIKFLKLKSNFL